jgi:hypothetical protein
MPAVDERRTWLADQDAFLDKQLEPGEIVVARSMGCSKHLIDPRMVDPNAKGRPLVTDRRLVFAQRLRQPPHRGEWFPHSIAFSDITSWRLGTTHDERPILQLEHPPISVFFHVPEHRFLSFAWGNAEAALDRTMTTIRFPKRGDPAFVAIRDRLEGDGVPAGEPFVIRPPGTREGRTRGTVVMLQRATLRSRARFRLHELEYALYHGHVAWRVRLPSWLLLAVPAWFISLWLVLPAIALAEAVWIAGLQWSHWRNRTPRWAP